MSLDLDPRQRAMLQEMGVTVWWPAAPLLPDRAGASGVPSHQQQAARSAQPQLPARHSLTSAPAVLEAPVASGERQSAIARMDWPALQAAVQDCQDCGLCAQRKKTVFGAGQLSAHAGTAPQVDWLVVGEAPGEQEDLRGEPFVGPAGQLLDNMLKAVRLQGAAQPALSRQHRVYITNVIKCRPPGNRNPQPAEIAQCTPYLARQIALLQPRLILALGRFAADALLASSQPAVGQMPLGKLRGQVYAYQGIPVVVSYHPAYLLRSPADKAKAWADLCLAAEVFHAQAA